MSPSATQVDQDKDINGANGISGTNGANGINLLKVQKRYEEERDKRLRPDGNSQYIDMSVSEKFRYMLEDPWVDATTIKDARTMFPNNRCQLLILGAGWGGICYGTCGSHITFRLSINKIEE